MTATIRAVTAEDVRQIDTFRYEPPYDFYDGVDEPIKEPEKYYAVLNGAGTLVGFYYFDVRGDVVEIGLGLRPDLAGRRLGRQFVSDGIAFARERFQPSKIVLNVAEFNLRAIKVYERAGFRRTGAHVRTFERWGAVPFVEMELGE